MTIRSRSHASILSSSARAIARSRSRSGTLVCHAPPRWGHLVARVMGPGEELEPPSCTRWRRLRMDLTVTSEVLLRLRPTGGMDSAAAVRASRRLAASADSRRILRDFARLLPTSLRMNCSSFGWSQDRTCRLSLLERSRYTAGGFGRRSDACRRMLEAGNSNATASCPDGAIDRRLALRVAHCSRLQAPTGGRPRNRAEHRTHDR